MKLRSDLLTLGAVFVIIIVFFSRFVTGHNLLFSTGSGWSDMVDYNYPQRVFLSEQLRENNIPLWTPYQGNGFPFLAQAEAGVFYPINLVLFRFLDPVLALNWSLITALMILAAGTFYLSKLLGLGKLLSVYTALLMPFSGFFIAHLHHVQVIQSAAFVPWGFLIAEKIILKPKIIYAVLLAIPFSLSILAGHLSTAYSVILVVSLYLVVRLKVWKLIWDIETLHSDESKKKDWREIFLTLTPLSLLILSCFITFLICAINLFPTLEMIPYSTRASGDEFKQISIGYKPLPLEQLITLFNPYYYGDPSVDSYRFENFKFWEYAGFIGLIPLIMALVAFFLTGFKYLTLKIMVVISWLIVLSQPQPLFNVIWQYLPGANLSRLPSRYLLFTDLFLIIISAFGLMFLTQKLKLAKNLKASVVVLAALITIAEIWGYFYFFYNAIPADKWNQIPQTGQFFKQDKDFFRVYTLEKHRFNSQVLKASRGWRGNLENFLFEKEMLAGTTPTLFKVYNIYFPNEETGSFSLKRRAEISTLAFKYGVLRRYSLKILGLSNVKYLISHSYAPLPENEDLKKVLTIPSNSAQIPDVEVYQNLKFLPRAFLVKDKKVLDQSQILPFMSRDEFDPKKTVLLEKEVNLTEKQALEVTQKIETISDKPQKTVFKVSLSEGGFFVLVDTWYPGWVAKVDGVESEVLRANYAFRALALNAGVHSVEFEYKPKSFYYGSVTSGVSWLAVIIFLFFTVLKKR